MSYSVYYTIRSNEKTSYYIDSLFNGRVLVYDFKRVFETPMFDSYQEAYNYIVEHNILNCHIRKHISSSSNYRVIDYKQKYNLGGGKYA